MNLTNSDIIILSILIGIIVIVGIICIILTIKGGNKKTKKEVKESEFSDEPKKSEPDIHIALATENIPDVEDRPVVMEEEEEPILEEVDIPITIDEEDEALIKNALDKEPEYEEVKEEEPLIEDYDLSEEVPTKEETEEHTKLEDVLSAMQRDLERQKYDKIDAYEEDQEENAVISYQELLDRKMALNDENDYPTEKEDIVSRINRVKEEVKDEPVQNRDSYMEKLANYDTEIEPKYEWKDERQFASSDFISPIFGRQDSNTFEYPTVKKTVETEEYKESYMTDEGIKEEPIITRTEETIETLGEDLDDAEFLNALKDFRKNL